MSRHAQKLLAEVVDKATAARAEVARLESALSQAKAESKQAQKRAATVSRMVADMYPDDAVASGCAEWHAEPACCECKNPVEVCVCRAAVVA